MRVPTASLLTHVVERHHSLPAWPIRPRLWIRYRPPRPSRTRSQRSSRARRRSAPLRIVPNVGDILCRLPSRIPSRPIKDTQREPIGKRRRRRGDGVRPRGPRSSSSPLRAARWRRGRQRLHDDRVLGRYPLQRPVPRDVRRLVGGLAELAGLADRFCSPRHVRQGAGDPGGVPREDFW